MLYIIILSFISTSIIMLNIEADTEFYASLCILIAMILVYGFFTVMLFSKRNEQPIKSKSPPLLLLSIAGNFVSMVALSIILAFGSFYTSNHVGDARILIVCLIISEIFGFPTMMLGCIFRALQLYQIYKITPETVISTPRIDRELKNSVHLNLKHYAKWLLILLGSFFLLGIVLITAYYSNWNDLDSFEWSSIRNGVMYTFTLILNFAGPFVLGVLGILLVRQGDREVQMSFEITSTTIFCTLSAGAFHLSLLHYLFFMRKTSQIKFDSMFVIFSSSMLLLRNFFYFLVSTIHPVIKSSVTNIIPYGETRECVGGVDITLSTELPYLYFSQFIEQEHGTGGKCLITLYTRIKMYEDMAKSNPEDAQVKKLAKDIFEEFSAAKELIEMNKSAIEVLQELLKKRFKDMPERTSEKRLFDPLYSFVINQLQACFKEFKRSGLYLHLYDQLKQNEIIYERLLHAELL